MARSSERLIAYGFGKTGLEVDGKPVKIKGETPQELLADMKKKRKQYQELGKEKDYDAALEKAAAHDEAEIVKNQVALLDYPKPITRYQAVFESFQKSIEPIYFWSFNFLGDLGFPIVDKVTDIFTAAEHSSFYGAAGQRLGLAQDKASAYLATIGRMVKDLFQLVRELRWIDERLGYYEESKDRVVDGKKIEAKAGAEIALKGMWVDMVDGVVNGQRTGANIFTMAQQLQFTSLPDLFFSIHPKKKEEVDKVVEDRLGTDFNESVKNTLKRKLFQYLAWKEATYAEMKSRKTFTLKYLRQHYNSIRMYIAWVKPYLKHIERLTGESERQESPSLIAAFETSMVEIEIIGRLMASGAKETYSCVMLTFEYTTKPSMQYQTEGYHRGPIHVGETKVTWRAYAWTEKQIQNYIAMRTKQDLELLGSIDASLKDAMEALGDDLTKYLEEAEQWLPKPEKEEEAPKKKKQSFDIFEPFISIGKGVGEVFKPLMPAEKKKGGGGGGDAGKAGGAAKGLCNVHYQIFKKAHGMLAW